jgi:hypothetical protein
VASLACGFLPTGLIKLLGNRFTTLSPEGPIGYSFEARYRSGVSWQFRGLCQLAVALLLLIPGIITLGAIASVPIILNVVVVTLSLPFDDTSPITGLMLLGSIHLLCWDYDRLKCLLGDRQGLPEAPPAYIGEPELARAR